MDRRYWLLVGCCLAVIGALLVVGVVSSGVIRHIVQTSPLWIVIALGVRRSGWSKWAAIPCFAFWLLLMTAIWLFLLGWARFVSGTFTATEILMTLIVGVASVVGFRGALSLNSNIRIARAVSGLVFVLILQMAMFRLSLTPQIAHR